MCSIKQYSLGHEYGNSLSLNNNIHALFRTFGGRPKAEDYMNELQTLADQIGNSARYENAYYFFAGYDSPYKVSDRHNEVWLKAL
jgi:hypothetical protein